MGKGLPHTLQGATMFKLDQIADGFITLTVSPTTAYLLALGCEVAHREVMENGFSATENGFETTATQQDEMAIMLMAFSSTFQAAAFAADFTRPRAARSFMGFQDDQNAYFKGTDKPADSDTTATE